MFLYLFFQIVNIKIKFIWIEYNKPKECFSFPCKAQLSFCRCSSRSAKKIRKSKVIVYISVSFSKFLYWQPSIYQRDRSLSKSSKSSLFFKISYLFLKSPITFHWIDNLKSGLPHITVRQILFLFLQSSIKYL